MRTHRGSAEQPDAQAGLRRRLRAPLIAVESLRPGDRQAQRAAFSASERSARSRLRAGAKRSTDVVLATVMLICFAPLFALAAIAIRLNSPGPVFFRQRRIGRDGCEFTMVKFRSMAMDATPDSHRRYIESLARLPARPTARGEAGLLKLTDDPRVTGVGAVLRKLSIDEAPQLLNVLAGQMSIVGPRPAVPYELDVYMPEHFERFRVRPGITGLWQVSGRNRLGFYEMLDLDVEYVRRQGFAYDIALILRTPVAIARAHTA